MLKVLWQIAKKLYRKRIFIFIVFATRFIWSLRLLITMLILEYNLDGIINIFYLFGSSFRLSGFIAFTLFAWFDCDEWRMNYIILEIIVIWSSWKWWSVKYCLKLYYIPLYNDQKIIEMMMMLIVYRWKIFVYIGGRWLIIFHFYR